MKKLIGVFVLVLLVSSLSAQVLTNKFVSALAVGAADENGKITHNVILTAGGQVKASLIDGSTDMFFRGVYNSSGSGLTGFFIKQTLNSWLNATAGLMARPITLANRISPVTGESGFESSAQAAVPGSALGGSINANFGPVSISGAVHRLPKEKIPEYNASFGIVNDSLGFSFKIGAYKSDADQGVAGTVSAGIVKLMLYSAETKKSMLFELNHEILSFYFTMVDDSKNESNDLEFGFCKSFSLPQITPSTNALIGLAYNVETKSVMSYLWVYLN